MAAARANSTIDYLKNSQDCAKLLTQVTIGKTSVINQGEIYIQRKNKKESLRLSNFDAQRRIPEQVWYDSLR